MSDTNDTGNTVDTTATETKRPFFIIFSIRTLENLSNLINKYYDIAKEERDEELDDLDDFSLLVPDKFKGEQTERTIAVLDEEVFKLLKDDEKSLDNFKIERLQLRKHFYPNQRHNETHNFYINLPKNLSLTQCQTHLIERMSSLRKLKLWEKNDYKLVFPEMNRDQDKHSGIAHIYFNKIAENNLEDNVLSKIYINYTKWPGTTLEVHCYWFRPKDGSKSSENLNVGKNDVNNRGSPRIADKMPEVKLHNVWEEKKGNHH